MIGGGAGKQAIADINKKQTEANSMNYTIQLTGDEVSTLGWATNRGYFPEETFSAMHLAEGQDEEGDGLLTWEIPEHAAWAISMQREDDPHSLFACIGGDMLERLLELENSIV